MRALYQKILITSIASIALALICAVLFTGMGCSAPVQLDTPANLSVDEYLDMTWDSVDNASGYVVTVDGIEYEATENKFDLFEIFTSEQYKEYEISVKAKGNKKYIDSEFSDTLVYKFNPYFTAQIRYTENEAGVTVAILSAKYPSGIKGPVVVPSIVNGISVNIIDMFAFSNAKNMTCIYLPDSVWAISKRAFSGCESLKKIRVPDNLNSTGLKAFNDCKSLESYELKRRELLCLGYNFDTCDNLNELKVDSENERYYSESNCIISKESNVLVRGCNGSKIPEYIEEIGDDAFSGSVHLQSINLPDGLKRIGDRAFKNCVELTELHIPSTVEYISSTAFDHCSNLQTITVDEGNSVYKSADNCIIDIENKIVVRGSKAMVIPDDVEAIGDFAYSGIMGVKELIIPRYIKNIGARAFYESNNLESIYLPDGLTSIGPEAFGLCEYLNGVTVPLGAKCKGEPFGPCDVSVEEGFSLEVIRYSGLHGSVVYNSGDQFVSTSLNTLDLRFCDIKSDGGYPYVYSFEYSEKCSKVFKSSYLYNNNLGYDRTYEEAVELQDYVTNPIAPIRLGYTFKGWTTNEGSNIPEYPAYRNKYGQLCAFGLKEREQTPVGTTLYAVWEKNT